MPKPDAATFGSGGPSSYNETRKRWRDREKPQETESLKGGLTWGTTFDPYRKKEAGVVSKSLNINTQEWVQRKIAEGDIEGGMSSSQSGTSIFDPVLCELVYRWFCPSGGLILDPFAGGSVRGIVAATLGHEYTGIDLRPEQIAANQQQSLAITPDRQPRWIAGDSRNAAALAPGQYDLIFSCPPYADLERYSDDPRDLSTMSYEAFLTAYRQVIAACVGMLGPNRFAVFVVGDIRDKKGFYRNFPGHTIEAFEACGATLYNEAILVTAVGSLPIRVGKQFTSGRKLGKTHQNVLCFYKGDPKTIRNEYGETEEFNLDTERNEIDAT